MTHQDLTKLSHEELVALIQKEREQKNGPKVEWAKGREGVAMNITFPGKRSRYLELEEFEYIVQNGDSILEQLVEA